MKRVLLDSEVRRSIARFGESVRYADERLTDLERRRERLAEQLAVVDRRLTLARKRQKQLRKLRVEFEEISRGLPP